MMHVNQRKKEFKKEYAHFYRYKCKKTLTRGQVRASLVTISEISPSVDALKSNIKDVNCVCFFISSILFSNVLEKIHFPRQSR